MSRILTAVMVGCVLAFGAGVRADEKGDTAAAAERVADVMAEAERLYVRGAFDDSMKVLLSAFPKAGRTPAQTVVLANAVRRHDPKLAYEMHRQAALAAPENSSAQFEWAVDQQRAREWAGAAASYAAFDKLRPGFAPAYGLWAQCLIEQGKLKEACAMWARSEAPGTYGSLQEFQRLVCEANWQVSPFVTRRELFIKARGGDMDAARSLVALDANFPSNWWTQGPMPAYLTGDLEMLEKVKFADTHGIKEIMDAGQVAQAVLRRRVDMAEFLKQKGYLFDPKGTLPKDPAAMSVIVGAAIARRTLTQEEAIDAWGATVLNAGKAAKDPELLTVAANIYAGTAELEKIQQFGWDNTKDDRFAGSLIMGLYLAGKLAPEDARLTRAMKDFPRNSQIAAVNVELLASAEKLSEQAVAAAIKAEYSRFSVVYPEQEPSARMLAGYFKVLDGLIKSKQKA